MTSAGPASCSENLAPRMLARVAKEIRALHKEPPEGVRLVIENENSQLGGAASAACLNEVIVSDFVWNLKEKCHFFL